MARTGNHGQIIPRDRALLHRMYWHEEMTLVQIAEQFGVAFSSVRRVFDQLDIPRKSGGQVKTYCECGQPVQKIKHATNGSSYGRECKDCRRLRRNAVARAYNKRTVVAIRRAENMRQWYVEGAKNPTREDQWIRKGVHLLRSARRALATGKINPAASGWRNAELGREKISQRSCLR